MFCCHQVIIASLATFTRLHTTAQWKWNSLIYMELSLPWKFHWSVIIAEFSMDIPNMEILKLVGTTPRWDLQLRCQVLLLYIELIVSQCSLRFASNLCLLIYLAVFDLKLIFIKLHSCHSWVSFSSFAVSYTCVMKFTILNLVRAFWFTIVSDVGISLRTLHNVSYLFMLTYLNK